MPAGAPISFARTARHVSRSCRQTDSVDVTSVCAATGRVASNAPLATRIAKIKADSCDGDRSSRSLRTHPRVIVSNSCSLLSVDHFPNRHMDFRVKPAEDSLQAVQSGAG
jgi:hypothetical protein